VTPPVPPISTCTVGERYKILLKEYALVLVLLLGVVSSVHSQDSLLYKLDTLPTKELLLESLGEYHTEEAVFLIMEFTYVEKWQWLRYAPSFGWNFISNTPYIGYNSTDLFNAINHKRKKTSQLKALIHKINLDYNKKSISLVYRIELYKSLEYTYSQKLKIIDLEKTYFGILKEEYKQHKLEPTKYIKADISYQNKVLELSQLRFRLKQLKVEILELAYFGDRVTLFNSYSDVPSN
jgi:hypothetical protein